MTRARNAAIMLLALISVLSSCHEQSKQLRTTTCYQVELLAYVKGVPCTDSLCIAYRDSWTALFKERSGLTDDYFNKHLTLYGSEIDTWDQGVSFRICYEVSLDWAVAYTCDQFIIKINEGNTDFPAASLPRGTYLTKQDIVTAIEHQAFNSEITKLSSAENLLFNSRNSANDFLMDKASVTKLCPADVRINHTTGELTLYSWAMFNSDMSQCIQATLSLINGTTSVVEGPCLIN